MKKILAIYDQDSLYSTRLLSYLCRTKDLHYTIVGFTNEDSIREYLENNQIDILLVDEKVLSQAEEFPSVQRILVLMGTRQNKIRQYEAIFKYQSTDCIMEELLRLAIPEEEKKDLISFSEVTIYTIYSPAREHHHSAYSCALANLLSQSIPTLYLNFSMYLKEDVQTRDEMDYGLSEMIYYIKQGQGLKEHLKDVIRTKQQLSYIKGVKYAFDLLSLTKDDIRLMLDELVSYGRYQAIVINLSFFSEAVEELLKRSNLFFLLKTDNKNEDYICDSFLQQMRAYFGEETMKSLSVLTIRSEDEHELMMGKIPESEGVIASVMRGGVKLRMTS